MPQPPPETHDLPRTSAAAVGISELLAAVEGLRDTWADRANFLEETAGYNEDTPAQVNKTQARVIRICICELYRAIEAANAPGERPATDTE